MFDLRPLSVFVFLFGCPSSRVPAPAPTVEVVDPARAATAAYAGKDWPAFVTHQRAVVDADPESVGDRYNLACGYALNGQRDEALTELRTLLARGVDFGAGQDRDFASLRGDPEFDALVVAFDALFPPVHHSERVFRVGDVDLAPEGITHDPTTGRFYVGSMRTGAVFAIDDGVATPFATLSVGGVPVSAVGLAADPARSRLWAIGTATDLHQAWDGSQEGVTAVLGLDPATGEIRETHVRAPGGSGFGFNDLAIGADGTLFLSGTDVYAVRPGQDQATVLGVQPAIRTSNGIAVGPDPNVLYVAADQRGIAVVDLTTLQRRWLEVPPGVELRAFDGLYRVDGALVGVQLGLGRWRVVRVDLDPSGTAVTGVEVLEQENPEIAGVTTGVPVGADLYFLARDLAPEGTGGTWDGLAAVWRTPIHP